MIQRMLKIKTSIVRYSSENTAIKNPLTANDWLLMEKLCEILEPFYDTTLEVQKISYYDFCLTYLYCSHSRFNPLTYITVVVSDVLP